MTAPPPLRRRPSGPETDRPDADGRAGGDSRPLCATTGQAAVCGGVAGDLERLNRYLARLAREGFYGKVTVSFQNGRACDVRIEQTHKLDEL